MEILISKDKYKMADGKVGFKVGSIEFSGEGEKEWVAKQLDKIIAKASDLAKIVPVEITGGDNGQEAMDADPEISKKTLATFLKEKSALNRQVDTFLATAIWLESQGKDVLSTSDVVEALEDAKQKPLNKPYQNLNQNIKKGTCAKKGKGFFVTHEGKDSL